MPQVAYLSLGSNVGERELHLHDAIARLQVAGNVVSVSSIYETEPIEFTEQPWFLNCAVSLETTQSPLLLMEAALEIERAMGRLRGQNQDQNKSQNKGPRTIDIDLLLCGDMIVNSPALTIPHPAMHHRRFVLAPLAEIAPDLVHPLLKKTIRKLLEELPAGQIVRRKI